MEFSAECEALFRAMEESGKVNQGKSRREKLFLKFSWRENGEACAELEEMKDSSRELDVLFRSAQTAFNQVRFVLQCF